MNVFFTENLILITLLLIFFGALVAPFIVRLLPKYAPWILCVIPLVPFIAFATNTPELIAGKTFIETYTWVDALGINFKFRLDGLSLLFALLVTGIGSLIVVYGGTYLANDKHLSKFYAYLFVFMGSMLGVVVSDNIFVLFVFWELTSISSYLLIGYKHGYEASRKSALQALLVTGTGGLALMAGFILIANVAGSPNISDWVANGHLVAHSIYFELILILVLLGAFTKSAQFPFHFWLPNAMVAPTPVSAYLHSATMVKAGVYLLARLNPYFAASSEWQYSLIGVGAITMIFGAVWALFQSDLKRILAYTTISALGVLVFFIGIGSTKAIQGAMVFLLAHALYKGGLFMVAGNIDHSTGTRDINKLSGLFKKMKFTGISAILASLSLAGFPLLLGFIAKELLYEAATKAPFMPLFFTLLIFITGAISVYLALVMGWKILFGNDSQPAAHEVKLGMFIGPVVLSSLGFVFGMFPGISIEGLLATTSFSVVPGSDFLKLKIWHGFNFVLLLSGITLVSGWVIYRKASIFKNTSKKLELLEKFGPEKIYTKSWEWLLLFAEKLIGIVQSGYLRYYIMTILISLIGLIVFPIVYYNLTHFNFSIKGLDLYDVLLAALIIGSTIFTIKATSRLAAIAILGVTGYAIAIFFAIYGAIDLAITQFLIETLIVVVFVFVLYKLPGYMKLSADHLRLRDAAIAIAGGASMTIVMLLVTNYPLMSESKEFFAANSYIMAKGRNVVNVILVDFRALDTLGEITVLAIAALGVFSMMKLKLSKREK